MNVKLKGREASLRTYSYSFIIVQSFGRGEYREYKMGGWLYVGE